MVAGFPNLFMITGPGSPSVLSNMMVSIEQHVDWIVGCLDDLRTEGSTAIEPTEDAVAGWVRHVNDYADITLMPQANSWYMGANVPGKPRVFLPYAGGVDGYRRVCDEVVAGDYVGFERRGPSGTRRVDGVIRRVQPDVAIMLELLDSLGLPTYDSMSPVEARAFSDVLSAQRPPGPEVGELVDGTLPGPAGDLAYRLYRPATDRSPPDHRVLPRRRLGARQRDVRRSVLPRPVRADGRRRRVRQLSPHAGGQVPGPGRGRARRGALGRRPRR